MSSLPAIDWHAMIVPTLSLAEIFLRGTAVYFLLYFILRILRRQAGALGISDLLVVVLIADAAQNAMSSRYDSLTEGLVLVATIAGWDYFLDWLGHRYPRVERWLRPPPLALVRDGRLLHRNLRQELITEEELLGQLREQGVARVEDVRRCYLEADGRISVICGDGKGGGNSRRQSL